MRNPKSSRTVLRTYSYFCWYHNNATEDIIIIIILFLIIASFVLLNEDVSVKANDDKDRDGNNNVRMAAMYQAIVSTGMKMEMRFFSFVFVFP